MSAWPKVLVASKCPSLTKLAKNKDQNVSVPEIMHKLEVWDRVGEERAGQRTGQERTRKEKKLHFMVFALRVSLCALHIHDGEGTGRKSETGFRIIPS